MAQTHFPAGSLAAFRPLMLCLSFAVAGIGRLTAADYYIDPAGNDSNAGTSSAAPWQSLGKVNGTVFQPGDNVLFKRGGSWVGTLSPQGSGNSSAQITLGSYGEGAKPLINGNGSWAVITLSSQSYWTIDGFEVTNPAGNDSSRSGIRVDWSGSGTMRGINLLNNDVHDVRGIKNVNDGGRNNGGIFFWINEPGKADGVLIQGNTVKTIYGQGIAFNAEAEYMGGGMNYANCSPNVVARGNTVISTSGDGILMLGTDNELVEHNEVGYVGHLSDNGNNIAAAWPTRHVNGLWQYNHVHHTKWLNANDSTAFDNDGFVSGATVFQYNYTHDNEGGFLMEYTWGGDAPGAMTIVRYNISWNENRILASNRNSARIYNNVFYNPGGTLDVNWTPNPSYILFSNNLFIGAERSAEFSRQLFMSNNFSGGVTRPVSSDGNRTQDPLFVNPNSTGDLAGFILQSGSPARSSGTIIVGNGGKDFWSATLPGTAPHRGASQINSIGDHAATPSFVQLSGPYSVELPYSGTSTVNFSGTVRDQNFRPISGAAVTWSVSPALAGYSINSSGVLTLSAGPQPQRVAIVAQSGSATASFSFTTLPAVAPVAGSFWTNTAGGEWSVSGNWQGDVIANGADQTATVALSTGVTINQGDASRTIGHLAFSNANHAIQGNALTLDVTTGTPVISVADSITATLGLSLVSSDGLQKSGTGALALTAVSSYGGGTTVNEGTLELRGASGGTGLINGAVTVNSGAALALTSGDGSGFGWSNTVTNLTINGGSVNASVGSHIGFGSYANVAMTGGAAISGNWQWNGDGLLGFNASGDSTNSISGALVLRADAGANHTFMVADGAATTDLQINAVLSDQYPEIGWVPASALIKAGPGAMQISATNTHDGGTTVSGGTLVVGVGGTLGGGSLAVGTGAVCDLRNTAGAVADGASIHLNGTGRLILANGVNELVARLFVDNVQLASGTYTAVSHPALISGGGSLIVTTSTPVAPGGLTVVSASATSLQLAWTDMASDETSYLVERSLTSGGSFIQIASLAAGTISYTDLGLSAGTTYFYRVRAANAIGSSAYSGEISARTAFGDSGIWTSMSNGDWSFAGNWHNGTVPGGMDSTATFAQFSGVTATLDSSRTVGNLSFAHSDYILTGSTLTLAASSGTSNLGVEGGGVTATIACSLEGSSALAKTGSGTLKLTSVSSYNGGTSVNEGRLELHGAAGGTGLIRGAVTVNAGATLAITGGDGTGFGWGNNVTNLTINGGTVNASGGSHIGFGAYTSVLLKAGGNMAGSWQWNGDGLLGFNCSGDSTNTISGSLSLRSDAGVNHTLTVADGASAIDLLVNAALTDTYPDVWWLSPSVLIKNGAGTMALTASNSYDGNTIVNAGTLRLGNGSNHTNLANSADLILAAGASLHLDFTGTDTIDELVVGGVAKSPGVYSSANSAFITGPGTLTVTSGPPSDYETWRLSSGIIGGPDADDDRDGRSNRFEYAFGQNPAVPSGNPVTFLSRSAGPHVTYLRRKPALSGLDYSIWTSTTLGAWEEDTAATQSLRALPGSDNEFVDVTLSPARVAGDRLFIQVRFD